MNEEEVKTKVVLPFLQRLGFKSSDLQLETSFYLRLGRHVLDPSTGNTAQRQGAGARLDILVRRSDENLFIVETKEAAQELTDDDRDQAISYARLVHPIAPYSLVTNGTRWKLFDSVSKQDLDPSTFRVKDRYEVTLPEDLRSQALSFFLGYSQSNMQRFCAEQVAASLKPLVGSPTDLDKKFIPDLHVPDEMLETELQALLSGGSPGFLIAADSGLGKTSEMCYHARRLLSAGSVAVLFFQGYLLESGIATAVAEEFNWTFSEQQSPVELFRRLQSTLKNRPLVLFLDAIDEWNYAQKIPNLLNFLRLAKAYPIKLIFSCKAAAWTSFAEHSGTSTGIEDYLHRIRSSDGPAVGFTLRGFNARTFHAALQKYSNVFDVHPQFEDAVLNQSQRNPFLLRVFFAVAKTHGLQQLTFSSSEFFAAYYHQLLAKTGDSEKADAQLQAIAKVLFEQNQDVVELNVARNKLDLGLNETLLPALFEFNILTKSPDNAARIGFYFQQLRDYLITFRVLHWSTLSKDDFAASIKTLYNEGVHADSLSFYYRHATEDQKRAVDGPLFENAQKYLHFYVQIVTDHFPALKTRFRPGTIGCIGFIAEIIISKRALGYYGFREITASDTEILFVPVEAFFSRSNLMHLHGAEELFWASSAAGFTAIDVEIEVVENEIELQLKKLADKRMLNEEASTGLLHETLASIVFAEPATFQDFFMHADAPLAHPFPYERRRVLQYPLNYQRIREAFLRKHLFNQILGELIDEKCRRGEGREIWHGDVPSFSCDVLKAEEKVIKQKVEEAIASGAWIQSRYGFPSLASELDTVLQALEKSGVAIEQQWMERSTLFNLLRTDASQGLFAAKDYFATLFSAFLEDYRCLIDHNFPTLQTHFLLRSQMPCCVVIVLDPSLVDDVRSGNHMGHPVHILFCKPAKPISENTVLVGDASELQGRNPHFEFRGDKYEGFHLRWDSLMSYTFSSDASIGMKREHHNLALHKLVYEQVQTELPTVLKALRKFLHLPQRQRSL